MSVVVVTRMQDLAYEFDTPDPQSGMGRPPPAPTLPACGWRGHKHPGVVTQTSVPLNFSAVVASSCL